MVWIWWPRQARHNVCCEKASTIADPREPWLICSCLALRSSSKCSSTKRSDFSSLRPCRSTCRSHGGHDSKATAQGPAAQPEGTPAASSSEALSLDHCADPATHALHSFKHLKLGKRYTHKDHPCMVFTLDTRSLDYGSYATKEQALVQPRDISP